MFSCFLTKGKKAFTYPFYPFSGIYIFSPFNDKILFTINNKQLLDSVIYGVEKITDKGTLNYSKSSAFESDLVRTAARKCMASSYNKKFEDILIQPSDAANRFRYPEAYIFSENKKIDISLSHDGRFVAYAFFKK